MLVRTINNIATSTLLAAALLAGVLCSSADAQLIRLKDRAAVSGDTVVLSDIAMFEGLPKGAGRIVVLLSRKTRQHESIGVSQVEKALLNVSINPAKVAFSGSAVCTVAMTDLIVDEKAESRKQDQAEIEKKSAKSRLEKMDQVTVVADVRDGTIAGYITTMAAEKLNCDASQLRIKFNRASSSMAKMAVSGDMSIRFDDEITGPGDCCWRVEYTSNGRRIRRSLTGSICVVREVLVTAGPMKSGRLISESDITTAEVADDGSGEYFTSKSDLVGRQLRRATGSGEPYDQNNIESPILVRGGSEVWVTCGVVKMSAKARQSGRMGEMVRVENPRSGRDFQAIVIGPDQVKIGFDDSTTAGGSL